jgi:hypothetical protein
MPLSSSIVVKKESPYYQFLFYQSIKLMEVGQIDQFVASEHGQKMSCDSGTKKGSPIGMEKLSILFIILLCGSIFSCLICCIEYIHPKRYHNQPPTPPPTPITPPHLPPPMCTPNPAPTLPTHLTTPPYTEPNPHNPNKPPIPTTPTNNTNRLTADNAIDDDNVGKMVEDAIELLQLFESTKNQSNLQSVAAILEQLGYTKEKFF